MATEQGLAYAKLLADLEGVRGFLLDMLAPVPERDARRILPGFSNHLHWHLGHLLYVQGSVLYARAGDPAPVPKSFRPYFGYGTSPAGYDSLAPDWDELLGRARAMSSGLPAALGPRVGAPLRRPFKLMNIPVATVGEAIPFLLVHEGDHLSRVKLILAGLSRAS